jgi:TfoX/Sxy family transcriptional regulator of competence genes
MSTTKDFAAYVLDQVDEHSARVRGMFGEFALYVDEKVVGFICDNTLFLKITLGTKEVLENFAERGPAYPGSKDYYIISDEMLEERKLMKKAIEACVQDVPIKKKK